MSACLLATMVAACDLPPVHWAVARYERDRSDFRTAVAEIQRCRPVEIGETFWIDEVVRIDGSARPVRCRAPGQGPEGFLKTVKRLRVSSIFYRRLADGSDQVEFTLATRGLAMSGGSQSLVFNSRAGRPMSTSDGFEVYPADPADRRWSIIEEWNN